MLVTIQNERYTAVISSLGAELQSFRENDGFEYIWEGKEEFWSGRSPVLFPIIGNLRNDQIQINGKNYSIPKHGFARRMEFTLIGSDEGSAVFELKANEATLTQYPFLFSLTLSYSFTEDGLRIDYRVKNCGEEPMLYCLGTHPAFRCPLMEEERFEDYRVSFNKNEAGKSLVYENKIKAIDMAQQADVLKDNGIDLNYRLFDNDALIFDSISSDAVRLSHREKGHGMELRFADFDAIGVWTPFHRESPFVCLEPWNGMAVRTDEGDDFAKKRLVKTIEPQTTDCYYLEFVPLNG